MFATSVGSTGSAAVIESGPVGLLSGLGDALVALACYPRREAGCCSATRREAVHDRAIGSNTIAGPGDAHTLPRCARQPDTAA